MLEEIDIDDLYDYVRIAFKGDGDLPQYHISDCDYVEHTYNEILKTSRMLPLTCYKVGEFGFTVTSPGLLYSFGININHRDKETLQKWFEEITNILVKFDVALHSKNTRAIAHLQKQGMKITDYMTILSY